MKNIIFFIDLDGTLLSKTKKILDRNIKALEKLHDAGGRIIIATGRPIFSAERYKKEIETRSKCKIDLIVSLSGMYVKDYLKNKIIGYKINNAICKSIFKDCLLNNL